MLPILTSNEGLFDFFGGELTGAEGGEGGGAFLDLLSSMGAFATGQTELEGQAEASSQGTSQEDWDAAQLFVQPGLPSDPPHLLLDSDEGGADGALSLLGGEEATAAVELDGEEVGSSLINPERSALPTQAQETRQQQQSALNRGSGLGEAGQAIRALGGAPGEESGEAPTENGALPAAETGPASLDAEELLPGEGMGAEGALASEARPPETSPSGDLTPEVEVDSAAKAQGESDPSAEEGEGSPEPLPSEPGAEDSDLTLQEAERPLGRSSAPERREGRATRGVQAQADPGEVALPEFGEPAPLELDATQATSPLEATSETGEVRGQDLIGQIEISLEPGQEEARIQLHPEELGRVDVRVRRREGRMVATLTVERPETSAEIEAHLPELRDALAERGLELDEVEVQTDPSAFELDSGKGEGEGKERGDPAREGPQAEARSTRRPKPKARSARAALDTSTRAPGAALDTLA